MAELNDLCEIFVGETAEAFHLMQYAVIRDPARLEYARRVISEAMLRVVDHYAVRARAQRPAQISGGS